MQKISTTQPSGFWLVTIAAMTWGTIGVVTQAIYNSDTTTPLFINLARMLIAAPVLLIACWQVMGSRMFQVTRRDLALMALSGVFLAISQASYFAGIRATGVTITTLLTCCVTPLAVSALSVVLKLERLTQRMMIAVVLAIIGSVLLTGLEAPEGTDYNLPLGMFYAITAGSTYAGTVICGRFLAGGYHSLQVTTVMFSAGTVVLLVINGLVGTVPVHTTQGWLGVLYLGIVPTALAYWLFQIGLRSVSATVASVITLLEPLIAALLAWVLFSETLAATGIAGAVLLVLSIVLLSVNKEG